MPNKDYYKTLGVEKNASDAEIKSAFRKLARKYHPDVAGKESEEKFKEINEAFQVLGDPQKRAQYDQFGPDVFRSSDFTDFRNFDFEYIFRDFGFGDIFSAFGGRRARRTGPKQGSDIRYDLEITLEQAFLGLNTKIELEVETLCKACKGTGGKDGKTEICSSCGGSGQTKRIQRTPFGQTVFVTTCPNCHGTGRIVKEKCAFCKGSGRTIEKKKIEVKIPSGVDEESYLRVAGQGEAGFNGGPSGDLYVVIHINPHKIFERHGNDLYCKKQVSLSKAILSGEIEVKTIDGKAKLKIPAGTQSHTIFRLRSQGMPDIHSRKRGDQLVKVIVEVPKKLSREQEKFVRENFNQEESDTTKGFFEKLKDFVS